MLNQGTSLPARYRDLDKSQAASISYLRAAWSQVQGFELVGSCVCSGLGIGGIEGYAVQRRFGMYRVQQVYFGPEVLL